MVVRRTDGGNASVVELGGSCRSGGAANSPCSGTARLKSLSIGALNERFGCFKSIKPHQTHDAVIPFHFLSNQILSLIQRLVNFGFTVRGKANK